MKRHDLKLDKYNISPQRYRELYYFCLQYDQRRAQIENLRHKSSPPPDGQPRGNGTGDPTARAAIAAATKSKENEIIEQSAIEAGGDLYPWLFEAICYELKYNYLHTAKGMPCGRNEFDRIRHKFFYILDQKKDAI